MTKEDALTVINQMFAGLDPVERFLILAKLIDNEANYRCIPLPTFVEALHLAAEDREP